MPSKFLVNKYYITVNPHRYIYKGLMFSDTDVYYPNIIQLFNGKDFNNNQELIITKQLQKILDDGYNLDESIQIIKNKLNYEQRLYNKIKYSICYFNTVNEFSKPSVIRSIKDNAISYFMQIKYYLETNKSDYNNNRIETINNIIINTNNNHRLCRSIEEKLKLKI